MTPWRGGDGGGEATTTAAPAVPALGRVGHLGNIPGVLEALQSGTGIPGYTEAVAKFFPNTTWAHYATAYDGGTGGQTGFYNIMLNNNNPLAALTWWNGSCLWDHAMVQQVQATAATCYSRAHPAGAPRGRSRWRRHLLHSPISQ